MTTIKLSEREQRADASSAARLIFGRCPESSSGALAGQVRLLSAASPP